MKIVVCVKKTPDTETRVKIAGTSLDPSGVNYIMSPYDEFAMEAALQEEGAEVIVLSLGDAGCEKVLRTALAMGATSAIHLKCDYPGLGDARSVADALAGKIKELTPDLVLFGRQAIDSDGAIIPPLVAQKLGFGFVGFATELKIEGKKAMVGREIEGGKERFALELPACISTNKGLNQPRYASLKGVMEAKKKPLETIDCTLAASPVTKLELPPPRAAGKIVGEGADAVPELVRLLHEEAKVI